MGNIKEGFLRAVPQMLFYAGYAAIILLAIQLSASLMWGARP